MVFLLVLAEIVQNPVLETALLAEATEDPGNDPDQRNDSHHQPDNQVHTGVQVPCTILIRKMLLSVVDIPEMNQPTPHGDMENEEQQTDDLEETADGLVLVFPDNGQQQEGDPDQ